MLLRASVSRGDLFPPFPISRICLSHPPSLPPSLSCLPLSSPSRSVGLQLRRTRSKNSRRPSISVLCNRRRRRRRRFGGLLSLRWGGAGKGRGVTRLLGGGSSPEFICGSQLVWRDGEKKEAKGQPTKWCMQRTHYCCFPCIWDTIT